MYNKKLINLKTYIDEISPISLGIIFWWTVCYVVTYFLKSPSEAKWFVLFIGLFMFNILSFIYGRQWILVESKSKLKGPRERRLYRWILSILLCFVFNYIYYYYTMWQVIALYYLASLILILANYFYSHCKKASKKPNVKKVQ